MIFINDIGAIAQSCFPVVGVSDRHQIACLRLGIEMGIKMIDTAEIYADGKSEELIGEAIKRRRDNVFLATKFSPEHSDREAMKKALKGSLKRLQTDYVDLYQMHWKNPEVPIEKIISSLQCLMESGYTRYIGLCNVGIGDIRGLEIDTVQVEYNLYERSCEKELVSYCQERTIRLLAYSPLGKGRVLAKIPARLALGWVISQRGVTAITRSINAGHIIENASVLAFTRRAAEYLAEAVSPEIIEIDTKLIHVLGEHDSDPKLPIYTTLAEALTNDKGSSPSPMEIAEEIKKEGLLKPVRLKSNYDLINGRMRYWAWVIAYGWDKPIPAIVEGVTSE